MKKLNSLSDAIEAVLESVSVKDFLVFKFLTWLDKIADKMIEWGKQSNE